MMNTQEQGLGWRSASELSTGITAESGSNPNSEKDRPSDSLSRSEEPPAKVPYILIVEDNEADAFLIRRAIEAAGIRARLHLIRDGEEAIRYFDLADNVAAAEVPDLVILDINLPKRAGGDVLRHIRNSHSCGNSLVIGVSTSDSAREREELLKLGAYEYFRKPSEYDEFMKLGGLVTKALNLR
jgi:CheY-like chemotaxis protein